MRVLASEGNLMSLIEILSTGKTAGQLLISRDISWPRHAAGPYSTSDNQYIFLDDIELTVVSISDFSFRSVK